MRKVTRQQQCEEFVERALRDSMAVAIREYPGLLMLKTPINVDDVNEILGNDICWVRCGSCGKCFDEAIDFGDNVCCAGCLKKAMAMLEGSGE